MCASICCGHVTPRRHARFSSPRAQSRVAHTCVRSTHNARVPYPQARAIHSYAFRSTDGRAREACVWSARQVGARVACASVACMRALACTQRQLAAACVPTRQRARVAGRQRSGAIRGMRLVSGRAGKARLPVARLVAREASVLETECGMRVLRQCNPRAFLTDRSAAHSRRANAMCKA